MSVLAQVGQIARRSVLRTARQPANIIFPFVFPTALLAVTSAGLASATKLPGFPSDSFLAFFLAFPFIQGALFATMNAGTDLARDIQTGFLNRLALTPLRGGALIVGQLGGIAVLAFVQNCYYLTVGLIVGVRLESGIVGGVVLIILATAVAIAFGALGAFFALRTGSGEAVQGLFPLLFVGLFLSSMNLPRNLIEAGLVPNRCDVQPDLVPDRGAAQPDHRGLGLAGARARVRLRRGPCDRIPGCRHLGADAEVDADMKNFFSVAFAVAWRVLHNVFTTPSLLLPGLIFPLFFFTAFAGGLSRVDNIPGFDFPNGYTAFQFVFVLLQSAAFGGVFTGFGVARDFEYGFARRLLLGAPRRSGIVLGYALAATGRWLLTATILTIVALAVGMNVGGSGIDLVALYTLALFVNLAGAFWASGVAMRLRSVQAGPVMQLPVFLALFFAPVYVPLSLLEGWLHAVASVNPTTFLLEGGRSLISGSPEHVSVGFLVAIGLATLLSVWSWRGLKSAERAGV